MYIPHYYKNEDIKEVRDFIEQNGFGILVSCAGEAELRPFRQTQGDFAEGKSAQGDSARAPFDSAQGDNFAPVATHIPLLLDKDEQGRDILSGHVSRMNPHHNLFSPPFTGNDGDPPLDIARDRPEGLVD
ncbi:MAG: FMN-binding negative transcriptional regulator [Nitrososphaera sp.]